MSMSKAKKRNPADATLRNVRARVKHDLMLAVALRRLNVRVKMLETQMAQYFNSIEKPTKIVVRHRHV